jgi:hypothetical protein
MSDLKPLPAITAGRYRHYKGGEYEVLGVVRHSETLEPHVLYRPLDGSPDQWVRPFAMFTESVDVAGEPQPRFKLVAASASTVVPVLDRDIEHLSPDQLATEVRRLRTAIRGHRDATGHALCWHHPDLWSLLPEQTPPAIAVPDWPQFMRGCVRYRQSLDDQAPDARRTTLEFDAERSG